MGGDSVVAATIVGTVSIGGRLTPAMRRNDSKVRRLQDREQLRKALRDYDAGKIDHLSATEQEHFVASVKKRIAELNETIARFDRET